MKRGKGSTAVDLTVPASRAADAWVPSSCTLPSLEQPLRLAEFDRFFRTSVHRVARPSGTVLELRISPESHAAAMDLAVRENRCCSFFRFDFTPDAQGLLMRVGVRGERVDVLDALEARIVSMSPRRRDE